ncbi:ABC transporter ATP-binding protein [Anaerofilum sp. BX8]|uniref:ABC transporter ATP-binding protein n=1 Tax=Anaerofilum hominis TaxID=2763016 RepID=A0A923L1Y5_9FIRM|nr:ABC transporter ATP-binding protein [Anaerofilum hominis]MBC5582365.1 ABC transporter ATP-binding protein [Anaerofilum hominis]
MSYLKVKGLARTYGQGEGRVEALRGVSFEVQRGEFVAVMGPSGSGKSTLMHLLGGVERPTAGAIELEGVDLLALPEEKLTLFRRRQIGLVYQFYNLVPLLTVAENIALPLLLDGRAPAPGQLEGLAARLELSEKLGAYPHQLSGGQQQRAGIGRALITCPALLLADEPTGNLDSENTRQVMALLRGFHQSMGQTILMITHDRELALQAQRILTLEDGRIVRDEVNR